MTRRLSYWARVFVLGSFVAVGSTTLAPAGSEATGGPELKAGENPSSYLPSEVRLRKLHLVRPDLIPYPIAYEVFC
ncbi:MAG: hypothetical protein ACREIT_10855 [Tepidisphaeraceae bacterium]